MAKPTSASITDEPCVCGYLQRAADTPDNPIVFDRRTGEFHFTYPEPGCERPAELVIYHCPFCGGAAPASKRDLLFEVVTAAEEQRLAELLEPLASLGDAIAALGAPDFDDWMKLGQPERDGKPPTVERRREISYSNLSDLAEVRIQELPDGRICWRLWGKHRQHRSDA